MADLALQTLPDLGFCEDGSDAFGVDAGGVGEVEFDHFEGWGGWLGGGLMMSR